ncbi:MAG TPA: replication initiator protein A [Telmatospirillum sp.]|nr:replication initiator protein A [Telmatospirillum sp.]
MNAIASVNLTFRDPPQGSNEQFDLFVPYITNLPLRDQRETMERPFFSLAKRKRLKPINYKSPDGSVWVNVDPHPTWGMATIWDADILIWAASQIAEHMRARKNEPPPRTIKFMPYQLLQAIRRDVGGDQYKRLREGLDRLKFTAIKTNIRGKGRDRQASFNWLDQWTDDVDEATGHSRGMSVTISDWLYEGIVKEGGVLAIHPDYFLLTGALERWLYRIARKHAGHQAYGCGITVAVLYDKSGSEDLPRRFKAALKDIVKNDCLPEYHLEWIDKTESGDAAIHMIERSLLDPAHKAFTFPVRKDKRRPVPEGEASPISRVSKA